MKVRSHAFAQSQLSWLLNRLALVSGKQLAQLLINALLLSILPALERRKSLLAPAAAGCASHEPNYMS